MLVYQAFAMGEAVKPENIQKRGGSVPEFVKPVFSPKKEEDGPIIMVTHEAASDVYVSKYIGKEKTWWDAEGVGWVEKELKRAMNFIKSNIPQSTRFFRTSGAHRKKKSDFF